MGSQTPVVNLSHLPWNMASISQDLKPCDFSCDPAKFAMMGSLHPGVHLGHLPSSPGRHLGHLPSLPRPATLATFHPPQSSHLGHLLQGRGANIPGSGSGASGLCGYYHPGIHWIRCIAPGFVWSTVDDMEYSVGHITESPGRRRLCSPVSRWSVAQLQVAGSPASRWPRST